MHLDFKIGACPASRRPPKRNMNHNMQENSYFLICVRWIIYTLFCFRGVMASRG